MDWLCQFESVSKSNGQLTKDTKIFCLKEEDSGHLRQITQHEYQSLEDQF